MISSVALLALYCAGGPFIDVPEARALSDAVVLDARGDDAHPPYLRDAQVVDWLALRDGWLRTGRLDDPDDLRRYFEKRGVRDDQPVLVYGAMPDGWGEEARIWWTLRYLGLDRIYIVNGGIRAWAAAGAPTTDRTTTPAKRGRIRTELAKRWRADHKAVDALRTRREGSIVDARTKAEFEGATPYWSSRGGHIPSARWLHYKALIGPDGRVLPTDVLKARFRQAGIVDPKRPVITYCTGGVRSAFVAAALTQAGFTEVANYDGSWWDWSRRTSLPVVKP